MEEANATATKLLTLLNVSATTKRASKRKLLLDEIAPPPRKLNKRKSVRVAEIASDEAVEHAEDTVQPEETSEEPMDEVPNGDADEKDEDPNASAYQVHFGAESPYLTAKSRESIEKGTWSVKRRKGKLGMAVEHFPEGYSAQNLLEDASLADKLASRFKKAQRDLPNDLRLLQDAVLQDIISYEDFYFSRLAHGNHAATRDSITLHLLNHISKKRKRILKNNERISRAARGTETSPPEVRDQGFTRPSVLAILPFRSWALRWVESLTSHTPKPEYQIENYARFISEYALPADAEDKLETAAPGTYPPDHVEMFKGNVDDSFRLGIKVTRKSVKLFSDFYQCDLIIGSPLGLRMSIEKDDNADFLSSIEILLIDQLDALSMQNWEHLQFVLSRINNLPKETRDTDFSRIKPWYLDGHAHYLRQTIALSPYDTPEFRHLFNSYFKNVAGKRRIEAPYSPVQVPEGVSQSFVTFECGGFKEEADKRFAYFTTKTLPSVMKSAVQSTNTIIFIPSSYDFIRVENHFRKLNTSFTVLSEYSTNQEISRARQAFFSGKKSFLLVSERFHFFRRYKIRGVRNVVFYGLPDHPQFYTEYLTYPFLDEGVDASDVTCKALYCKYDWMKLERIAGTESALELLKSAS